MKKVIIINLLLVLSIMLFAELMPQKTDFHKADKSVRANSITRPESRNVPEWEWEVPPQSLLTNYADYFQCYGALPIALQPEEHGGGIYIVYRVKDAAGISEVCYSYIDAEGNVDASQGIGEVGYYCDAEVDQESGDVFACWHAVVPDAPETADCFLTYDLYHIMQSSGLWKDPVITVIDSDNPPIPDPTEDDEFVWPQIKIGPSPVAGKQRIYLVASNGGAADGAVGYPSENPMICWADFELTDIEMQSDLEWSYRTIPTFDNWNAEDPMWYRPFCSWTVIDNKLIFMGYRVSNEDYDPDDIFCFVNENYGEGEFQEYYQEYQFEEDNPSWVDSDTGDTYYLFSDLENSPDEPYPAVFQSFMASGRFNIYPADNGSSVVFPGSMGILFDADETQLGMYRPFSYQIYAKMFRFDLVNHEFSFTDVYPSGANPNDNIPMKPWDLDEDGEYDEVYDDGMPMWAMDWPIFHYDEDSIFHYNYHYVTSNEENGWMAMIWVDGMNAKEANEGTAGFESWTAKPELTICISTDWGMTWSDPLFMNANPEDGNYVEELADMIPCFAYPGDKIEDAGNNEGILHLFFLDDNDYGSSHSQQHGLNSGSTFKYAALRMDFTSNSSEPVEIITSAPVVKNYPNPFNPETTIAFEVTTSGNVNIAIYNLKGQLVKNLVNDSYCSGTHTAIWNGTDNSGKSVPSGVYFYTTKAEDYSSTKKMILMK